MSIAWLAHQLSVLHDSEDRRVFDSIVVITDRRVLDRQLQRTVRQFEQTLGVVENIDTTSKQLKQALEEGAETMRALAELMRENGNTQGAQRVLTQALQLGRSFRVQGRLPEPAIQP